MRLIIFILDAGILIMIVAIILYVYASGYEKAQKEIAQKTKKSVSKNKKA